eukprot:Hpha_TRINITY_DN11747_c0_g1::TRINITY_DN11747_c0_g1_i1::g.32083::m.32083
MTTAQISEAEGVRFHIKRDKTTRDGRPDPPPGPRDGRTPGPGEYSTPAGMGNAERSRGGGSGWSTASRGGNSRAAAEARCFPGPGRYAVTRLFEKSLGEDDQDGGKDGKDGGKKEPSSVFGQRNVPSSSFGTAKRFAAFRKEKNIPVEEDEDPSWDTQWLRVGAFSGTFATASRKHPAANSCSPGPKYNLPGMASESLMKQGYMGGIMQGVGSKRFSGIDDRSPGPGTGRGHIEHTTMPGGPKMMHPYKDVGDSNDRFRDPTVNGARSGNCSPRNTHGLPPAELTPERIVRITDRMWTPASGRPLIKGEVGVFAGSAAYARAATPGGDKPRFASWARSRRFADNERERDRRSPGPAAYKPVETAVRRAAPRTLMGRAKQASSPPVTDAARRRPATAPQPQSPPPPPRQPHEASASDPNATSGGATPSPAPAEPPHPVPPIPGEASTSPPPKARSVRKKRAEVSGRGAGARSTEDRDFWLRPPPGPGPGDYTVEVKGGGQSYTIGAPVSKPPKAGPGPADYTPAKYSKTGKPFRDGEHNCAMNRAARFLPPPTESPILFRDTCRGDVVRMTPRGFKPRRDLFLGTVVSKDIDSITVRWKAPAGGGPPAELGGEPFPRVTTEARSWWDGPGRPMRDCAPGPGYYTPDKLPVRTPLIHGRNTTRCPDISTWMAVRRERERRLQAEREECARRLVVTGEVDEWRSMKADAAEKAAADVRPVGEPCTIFY